MTTREQIIEKKVNDTNDDIKETINNTNDTVTNPINTTSCPYEDTIDSKPWMTKEQLYDNMFQVHMNSLRDNFDLFKDEKDIAQNFPYKIMYDGYWVATKGLSSLKWHLPFDEYDYALIEILSNPKKFKKHPDIILELIPVCTEQERYQRFINKVKKEMYKNESGVVFQWVSFRSCTTEAIQKQQMKLVLKELKNLKKKIN
jgi:hypothetical protein